MGGIRFMTQTRLITGEDIITGKVNEAPLMQLAEGCHEPRSFRITERGFQTMGLTAVHTGQSGCIDEYIERNGCESIWDLIDLSKIQISTAPASDFMGGVAPLLAEGFTQPSIGSEDENFEGLSHQRRREGDSWGVRWVEGMRSWKGSLAGCILSSMRAGSSGVSGRVNKLWLQMCWHPLMKQDYMNDYGEGRMG